jgi:branched-chain amino acid transport system permease protein
MKSLAERIEAHRPSMAAAMLRSVAPFVIAVVLAYGVHVVLGPVFGRTWTVIFIDVGIAIVLAGSLNVVNGLAGQFSIGHAGFMLAGAYASAWLTYYGSISMWDASRVHGGLLGDGALLFIAACLVGGALAALFGLLVGLPSLRLRGDYLAIVTLGFGEILRVLGQITSAQVTDKAAIKGQSMASLADNLGGPKGFFSIPHYTNLFYVYAFAFILLILAYRLKYSSKGRALLAVRENEVAAEAVGVDTTRAKVVAFVMSAFFGGVGGALYAHRVTVVNPAELSFQKSFDLVIIVVIGGMGSITGVVIGAAILTILPELLRQFSDVHWTLAWTAKHRMIIYALALIAVMLSRPQGIMGVKELWETAWWRKLTARARKST